MITPIFLILALVALSALANPALSAGPNWPATLTIATASPGGTYHVYGAGLAKILTRALGLPVAERITEGPGENIQMIETGEAQIGFVTSGTAMQAWNGTAEWAEGRQYRSMRVLLPMYDTPFHFVAFKGSGINTLSDLTGRIIGIGPHEGTAGTYIPMFLKVLGIRARFAYGTWERLASEFSEGKIDLLAVAAGVPFPAISEFEAK